MRYFAGIFLLALGLLMGRPALADMSDYVGLQGQFDYYNERLSSQERMVQADLEQVQKWQNWLAPTVNKFNTRAYKMREAAQNCRNDLASGRLTGCTVKFRGQDISIDEAENVAASAERNAASCGTFQGEADMDARALSLRLQEIGRLRTDLAEWKRMNDEAVTEEIKVIGEFALGSFARMLAEDVEHIRALRRLIREHEKELTFNNTRLPYIMSKLQEDYLVYAAARVSQAVGKGFKEANPFAVYAAIENGIAIVVNAEAEFNEAVKAIADEPAIKDLMKNGGPEWDLLRSFVAMGMESAMEAADGEKILKSKWVKWIKKYKWGKKAYKGPWVDGVLKAAKLGNKMAPAVGVASFIVDSAYNGKQWQESLERIIERFKNAEQSQDAAEALHGLVERRNSRWSACPSP
jgi:hypothetical protein